MTHQDTSAAIEELSQAVRNNPEAIEIYLALGNLYRSQGDIERAIHIRNSLIRRPGLDAGLKARCYFELGRDFRRGGLLDRSREAFSQAAGLMGDTEEVHLELARLAADGGEFERAAEQYARVGRATAEAHFLARQAEERFERGEADQGEKLVDAALRASPTSPEAWLARVVQAARGASAPNLTRTLEDACAHIAPAQRFLLLEGLLETLGAATGPSEGPQPPQDARTELAAAALGVASRQPPDALWCFYCARLCLFAADRDGTRDWLQKALAFNSEFWLARLEMVSLVLAGQELTPFLREQLAFFIDHARRSKRFICRECGFRWDAIFFVCPRCRAWHSIVFRQEFL